MKKYKILTIDDQLEFHISLRQSILRSFFDLDIAYDMKEGWLRLKENKYDLILLDLDLIGAKRPQPEKGLKNIPLLRKEYPNIPIVVVTQYASIPLAINAVQNGARNFFDKSDYNPQKWKAQITQFIEEVKGIAKDKALNKMLDRQSRTKDAFIGVSPALQKIKRQLKKMVL